MFRFELPTISVPNDPPIALSFIDLFGQGANNYECSLKAHSSDSLTSKHVEYPNLEHFCGLPLYIINHDRWITLIVLLFWTIIVKSSFVEDKHQLGEQPE